MSEDRVIVTVGSQSQEYAILDRRPGEILIGPGPSLVTFVDDRWQVHGFNVPHTVTIKNEFSNRLNALLEEGRRLSGRPLVLSPGSRFINLTYDEDGRKYTYARVESATGDIYSQSGTQPRGNIYAGPYYGLEAIGPYGVLVNPTKLNQRLRELQNQ